MLSRRTFLSTACASVLAQPARTKFQFACMTLPYAAFPLERALAGIKTADYDHVAWGVTHKSRDGRVNHALSVEAAPAEAAALATRCRSMGLEPVMMFSTVNVEAPNAVDAHLRRVEQAAAAKIP